LLACQFIVNGYLNVLLTLNYYLLSLQQSIVAGLFTGLLPCF
jgi:hypothetical protein